MVFTRGIAGPLLVVRARCLADGIRRNIDEVPAATFAFLANATTNIEAYRRQDERENYRVGSKFTHGPLPKAI